MFYTKIYILHLPGKIKAQGAAFSSCSIILEIVIIMEIYSRGKKQVNEVRADKNTGGRIVVWWSTDNLILVYAGKIIV